MKKWKKLSAILLAGVMIFSSGLAAFATGDPTEATLKGEGETTYVDTDVYSVILPTSAAWDFILDPQGLVGAYRSGEVGTADQLENATPAQLAPFAGKIVPGTAFPVIQNRSSYDVALSVDIKVTGDATVVAASADVEPADGAAATANNILLNVQLQENSITTETPQTATFAAATTAVEVPLKATNQSLAFVLGSANYVFNSTSGTFFTFERVAESFGHGTALQLSGLVNKNADWSDFADDTKNIGIDVKFTLAKATGAQIALQSVSGAYGYKGVNVAEFGSGGGGNETTPLGFSTDTHALTANTWISVPFNFGGHEITAVTRESGANWVDLPLHSGGGTPAAHSYRLPAGGDAIEFWFTSAASTRNIQVTMNSETYSISFQVQ